MGASSYRRMSPTQKKQLKKPIPNPTKLPKKT